MWTAVQSATHPSWVKNLYRDYPHLQEMQIHLLTYIVFELWEKTGVLRKHRETMQIEKLLAAGLAHLPAVKQQR